jgi:acyl carrier protein
MELNKIIKESFNEDITTMNDDIRLMSFGEWDSLTHMFFITKLEETYGIELTGDEIAEMQTLGEIKKIIHSKGKDL